MSNFYQVVLNCHSFEEALDKAVERKDIDWVVFHIKNLRRFKKEIEDGVREGRILLDMPSKEEEADINKILEEYNTDKFTEAL